MRIDPATERFEMPIVVTLADIDVLGHVNNTVYLRWVQDVAIAHWISAATPTQQKAAAWVVVRHEIDYTTSAKMGDEITLRTWVGTTVKNYFERFTEVLRTKDRKVLARARTMWCPIDQKTGRPIRVSDDIRERFSVLNSASSSSQ